MLHSITARLLADDDINTLPVHGLAVVRGSDDIIEITVVDDDDEPVDLTGSIVEYAVRASDGAAAPAFALLADIIDGPGGVARVYPGAAETGGLSTATYRGQVWVTDDDGRHPGTKASDFKVLEATLLPGEGSTSATPISPLVRNVADLTALALVDASQLWDGFEMWVIDPGAYYQIRSDEGVDESIPAAGLDGAFWVEVESGAVASVNGQTGAVGIAPTILAANAAGLSAVPTVGSLAAGGLQNGQPAFISAGVSMGVYYLRTSALAADGVNVITVTDDGARRWIRDNWDQGLPRLVSAVSDVVSLNIAGDYSLNLPSSSKTFFPLNAVFNFESYNNLGDFTISPVIGLYYVPDPGTWGGRISADVTLSAVSMSAFRSNVPPLPTSGKIFSGAAFGVTTLQNAIRYPSSNPAFCKVVTPTDRAATGRVRMIGLLLD